MDQKSIEISVADVTFNQARGINTPDQRHRSFLWRRELHCRWDARRRAGNKMHSKIFIIKHQMHYVMKIILELFLRAIYQRLNLTPDCVIKRGRIVNLYWFECQIVRFIKSLRQASNLFAKCIYFIAARRVCAKFEHIGFKCCVEADRLRDNLALAAIGPICLPPLNYCSRRAEKNAVSKLSQTFVITSLPRTHARFSADQYVNDPANVLCQRIGPVQLGYDVSAAWKHFMSTNFSTR